MSGTNAAVVAEELETGSVKRVILTIILSIIAAVCIVAAIYGAVRFYGWYYDGDATAPVSAQIAAVPAAAPPAAATTATPATVSVAPAVPPSSVISTPASLVQNITLAEDCGHQFATLIVDQSVKGIVTVDWQGEGGPDFATSGQSIVLEVLKNEHEQKKIDQQEKRTRAQIADLKKQIGGIVTKLDELKTAASLAEADRNALRNIVTNTRTLLQKQTTTIEEMRSLLRDLRTAQAQATAAARTRPVTVVPVYRPCRP